MSIVIFSIKLKILLYYSAVDSSNAALLCIVAIYLHFKRVTSPRGSLPVGKVPGLV